MPLRGSYETLERIRGSFGIDSLNGRLAASAVEEIVDRFRQWCRSRGFRLDKILLNGSHTTGFVTPETDIDVVVITNDFSGKGYWERVGILRDILCKIFTPLEAVALIPGKWERGESFAGQAQEMSLARLHPNYAKQRKRG